MGGLADRFSWIRRFVNAEAQAQAEQDMAPPPAPVPDELRGEAMHATGIKLQLTEKLGRGAQASVYRGHITLIDGTRRDVAVKVPHDGHDHLVKQEASLFAGKSPARHVVASSQIYRFTQADGRSFDCMLQPLAEGGTIERAMADRRKDGKSFTPNEAAVVMAQVTLALRDTCMAHLDLKPENLMLANQQVVVGDWGIARKPGTPLREMYGTATYMSPESIGPTTCAKQQDIYSLGLIGYEMVSGQKARVFPKEAGPFPIMARIHGEKDGQYRTGDQYFDAVLNEAMRRDPAKRSSHRDLLADLYAYPEVRTWCNEGDRTAIAERLVDRDQRRLDAARDGVPYHRAEALDLVPAKALAEKWSGDPLLGQKLKAMVQRLEGRQQMAIQRTATTVSLAPKIEAPKSQASQVASEKGGQGIAAKMRDLAGEVRKRVAAAWERADPDFDKPTLQQLRFHLERPMQQSTDQRGSLRGVIDLEVLAQETRFKDRETKQAYPAQQIVTDPQRLRHLDQITAPERPSAQPNRGQGPGSQHQR